MGESSEEEDLQYESDAVEIEPQMDNLTGKSDENPGLEADDGSDDGEISLESDDDGVVEQVTIDAVEELTSSEDEPEEDVTVGQSEGESPDESVSGSNDKLDAEVVHAERVDDETGMDADNAIVIESEEPESLEEVIEDGAELVAEPELVDEPELVETEQNPKTVDRDETESSAIPSIPVYIDLGEDVYKLFNPVGEEEPELVDLPVLYTQPKQIVDLKVVDALHELRQFVEEDQGGGGMTSLHGEELALELKELGLSIGEDNTFAETVTIGQVLALYSGLRDNSENKVLHKFIQLNIKRQTRVSDRFAELEMQRSAGKSLEQLGRKRSVQGSDEVETKRTRLN